MRQIFIFTSNLPFGYTTCLNKGAYGQEIETGRLERVVEGEHQVPVIIAFLEGSVLGALNGEVPLEEVVLRLETRGITLTGAAKYSGLGSRWRSRSSWASRLIANEPCVEFMFIL